MLRKTCAAQKETKSGKNEATFEKLKNKALQEVVRRGMQSYQHDLKALTKPESRRSDLSLAAE